MVFDTTVFCGALLKPSGGNMKCLTLANGPFFTPVVSEEVLQEFVHKATTGLAGRVYAYPDVREWLNKLGP